MMLALGALLASVAGTVAVAVFERRPRPRMAVVTSRTRTPRR
jgi:hypothetical protein